MAHKSRCNYFLIPCCMFDFYSKFDAKFGEKSRSDSYLDYLERIGGGFEFELFRDKLRIPSTKNACFLGVNKRKDNNQISTAELVNERIEAVMGKSNAAMEFKPRDLTQEQIRSTRNCTKNVPNNIKTLIVGRVVDELVSQVGEIMKKHDGTEWNRGKTMTLNQVAELFDRDVLKKLKLECGGIKTLLRNHGRLFEVYDKDNVRLRVIDVNTFAALDEEKKKVLKTKRCPFDQYHPNGCLLKHQDCYFFHEK